MQHTVSVAVPPLPLVPGAFAGIYGRRVRMSPSGTGTSSKLFAVVALTGRPEHASSSERMQLSRNIGRVPTELSDVDDLEATTTLAEVLAQAGIVIDLADFLTVAALERAACKASSKAGWG